MEAYKLELRPMMRPLDIALEILRLAEFDSTCPKLSNTLAIDPVSPPLSRRKESSLLMSRATDHRQLCYVTGILLGNLRSGSIFHELS